MNCNGCGIYETCEKKNDPNIIHCFSKPYSICYKCMNSYSCELFSGKTVLCHNFKNKEELFNIDYS